jgi:broad specificity phosphatase PhoE
MVTNLAEAVACANRVESMLRARFGANATRVLLVGHGNASDTLIRSLTRHPEFHEEHLDNTHLWIAREESAGHFKLSRYNKLP